MRNKQKIIPNEIYTGQAQRNWTGQDSVGIYVGIPIIRRANCIID